MVAVPTCLPLYALARRVKARQLKTFLAYFAACHQVRKQEGKEGK